ncbi:proline-rich receptor-like protein kinase PERK9 [Lycium ferocissimum]|uniref:proline-rich receptor-like protein kinase PERK9 n=1 Tax=Lycium ferocissimum TaxID=112874 RepID=UPI0028149C8D|nr:proline-rich receptor-like protein kinase PERK9 [Lycium ferocissimum]
MATPYPPVRDPQGERPVRDLQGGLHLQFDDTMFEDFVFDMAPSASPAAGAAQEPSHQASQEAVDTQVHCSTPVGPQERPIQETTSYSPPHPSQEPTDPSQEPTQAPVDTQVHPSAPEVATPDEVEVETPDLTQPEVLSVPAGSDPKKKHVLVKGSRVRRRDDDHELERPVIKRKKGDGDDDEPGGDGMSLRPRDSLRHTTCGTHPR